MIDVVAEIPFCSVLIIVQLDLLDGVVSRMFTMSSSEEWLLPFSCIRIGSCIMAYYSNCLNNCNCKNFSDECLLKPTCSLSLSLSTVCFFIQSVFVCKVFNRIELSFLLYTDYVVGDKPGHPISDPR